MDMGSARVGGCLLGQVVSLSVAWDARVGSDFVEVSGGPMADPVAEGHLQGVEEGQVLGFKDCVGFINEPVEKLKAA